jgi:ketopantoate reductase
MQGNTTVVPMLNGIAHLARLTSASARHVMGGTCQIKRC